MGFAPLKALSALFDRSARRPASVAQRSYDGGGSGPRARWAPPGRCHDGRPILARRASLLEPALRPGEHRPLRIGREGELRCAQMTFRHQD